MGEKSNLPKELNSGDEVQKGAEDIETAFHDIAEILRRNASQAILEVGEYLLQRFFGGDEDRMRNLEVDHDKSKTSFNQLAEKFKTDEDSPRSKSWLYTVRKVYIDYMDLQDDEKTLQTFGKLGVGHKFLIADKFKELKEKKKWINKIALENLSVRKAKALMPERKDKQKLPAPRKLEFVLHSTRKQLQKRIDMFGELLEQKDHKHDDKLKTLKKRIEDINKDIQKYLESK